MVFSSMTFLWIFLPLLLFLYFIIKEKYQNILLLIFSLIFYAWGEPKYILLMISSIIINYLMSLLIDKTKKKNIRRLVFIITILINVGLLGYFKYFDFIISNLNKLPGVSLSTKNIILPIGISFYTFQIMSYIIDLYKKKIKVQKNILDLALYISFFPQLIAGPIVKYKDINNQIKKRKVTIESFTYGTKRFIYGLSKKVLIANTLALIVDSILEYNVTEITTSIAWICSLCYSLQIYYDFSGYSDMAIGLGKMFGFTFLENFNLPYQSKSITEFWKRWHISLSSWFKEYIYIPLGGNRKGKFKTYRNLWIVFIVTGVWHGAAWAFIVWGLYHGFFIFIERLGLKRVLDKLPILNHIYALLVINFGWVIFRITDFKYGLSFIKRMIIPTHFTSEIRTYTIITPRNIIIFVIAILFSCIIQILYNKVKNKEIIQKIVLVCEPIVILILWILCINSLVSNTYNPFIYYRF